MERDSSSPPSQDSAICPFPESDHSSPRPPNDFLKIRCNTILPCTLTFPRRYLSLDARNCNNASTEKDLFVASCDFRQNDRTNVSHKRLSIIGNWYAALANNALPTKTSQHNHDIWYEGSDTT
jgi:hypothetical protein